MRKYKLTLQENELTPLFTKLLVYQKQKLVIENRQDELQRLFSSLIQKDKIKWEQLVIALNNARQLYLLLLTYAQKKNLNIADTLSTVVGSIGDNWLLTKASYADKMQQIVTVVNELETSHNSLNELCELTLPTDSLTTSFMPVLDKWLMHYDQLKDWYHWCVIRKSLVEQNLNSVLSVVENDRYSGRQASKVYYKSVMHQLSMQIIDADKSLQLFNGVLFEELIAKYRQRTSEFQQLTKQELYCKLAEKIPFLAMEAASNSEVGILKRNITNGGRGMSIRRIIDQIPTLLPKLCPCMLMSPISVAQYLDLAGEKFDLVIFDEASQMPTSEAVGAIARGNALVVVGDPKQMPPTSFFSSTQLDEEEAELDDMESILDDCISLAMPSRYLTWHYRSKHESLIAFSNSQYYDGKLNTFPSVDDRASKVSLVPVKGVYDKGNTRSNRIEAECVVKEIIRRLSDAELSQRSIGVVSFSQAQQNLIEDLLVEELSKQPELEQLAYQGNEPIFIKNLENVQGDERDVILFSIGYGADKDGKVSMNFGPLNSKGGGRRLNVAVSRSRYEMVVFSSLRSEQIDLKRTKAIGVEGLKRFLEFAERGTLSIQATQQTHQSAVGMVELIAAEIRKSGYKVDTFVGRSNFKVDLAIVDPKEPETYLLGILCDGKSYFETKTTRDREVVQPSVLTMLKWNIMRVWSVDWYSNKERVLQRILKELENLKNKPNLKVMVQPTTLNSMVVHKPEVIVAPQNERVRNYEFAKFNPVLTPSNLEKLLESEALVTKQLFDLIATEQPITNTLIYKRIARIWGIPRVTPRLQNFINELLEDTYCEEMNDNRMVYWESDIHAKAYCYYRVDSNREILDIPLVEVMNAILFIVEQQIAIPHEDVKRLAAQALGFSRKGTNLEAATTEALNKLLAKGAIVDKEGMICVG
ncbi:MAG: AAA domain-containing protein [Phocaeicola sp.]